MEPDEKANTEGIASDVEGGTTDINELKVKAAGVGEGFVENVEDDGGDSGPEGPHGNH